GRRAAAPARPVRAGDRRARRTSHQRPARRPGGGARRRVDRGVRRRRLRHVDAAGAERPAAADRRQHPAADHARVRGRGGAGGPRHGGGGQPVPVRWHAGDLPGGRDAGGAGARVRRHPDRPRGGGRGCGRRVRRAAHHRPGRAGGARGGGRRRGLPRPQRAGGAAGGAGRRGPVRGAGGQPQAGRGGAGGAGPVAGGRAADQDPGRSGHRRPHPRGDRRVHPGRAGVPAGRTGRAGVACAGAGHRPGVWHDRGGLPAQPQRRARRSTVVLLRAGLPAGVPGRPGPVRRRRLRRRRRRRRRRRPRPGGRPAMSLPADVPALRAALQATGYLADDALATALFLAVRMGQPILLEGEPGVGKTEAAKALATALETTLVRLQCYEGLTAAEALYEWNYPKQLLAIRLAEAGGEKLAETDLFQRDYLLARPLLAALEHPGPAPAVLLLDEVDRADDEFEAFLLELLAEATVTIPELGTRTAAVPPVAVLTSNRTRDLHDALKRRCLYHFIAYPAPDRVAEIIRRRVPGIGDPLADQVAAAVARMR